MAISSLQFALWEKVSPGIAERRVNWWSDFYYWISLLES
tara:strand:+ start:127 stop:243 length:117 start_codon:yes stop_codon:yes gene_type:complete